MITFVSENNRTLQFINNLKDTTMEKKFRCLVCGYIHEGPEAPEECPICLVGADQFEEIVEPDGNN